MENSKKISNLITRALLAGVGALFIDKYFRGATLLSRTNIISASVLGGSQLVSEYITDKILPHLVQSKHAGLNSIEHYMIEPFISSSVYLFANQMISGNTYETPTYAIAKCAGLDVGAKYITDALHLDVNEIVQ